MTDNTEINPKYAAEYLRDEVIALLRTGLPKPWKELSEGQQEEIAARVEYMAKNAIVRVIQTIATVAPMAISATMGKLGTDKDRHAVVPITFGGQLSDDQKLAIWNHIGRQIVAVLMDPEDYNKFQTKVVVMKDEPALPLEGQQPGQPDWPEVAKAVADAPDAHVAEDDEIDPTVKPPSDLLDDDLDEDDGDQDVAKMINLDNPTKKPRQQPKK